MRLVNWVMSWVLPPLFAAGVAIALYDPSVVRTNRASCALLEWVSLRFFKDPLPRGKEAVRLVVAPIDFDSSGEKTAGLKSALNEIFHRDPRVQILEHCRPIGEVDSESARHRAELLRANWNADAIIWGQLEPGSVNGNDVTKLKLRIQTAGAIRQPEVYSLLGSEISVIDPSDESKMPDAFVIDFEKAVQAYILLRVMPTLDLTKDAGKLAFIKAMLKDVRPLLRAALKRKDQSDADYESVYRGYIQAVYVDYTRYVLRHSINVAVSQAKELDTFFDLKPRRSAQPVVSDSIEGEINRFLGEYDRFSEPAQRFERAASAFERAAQGTTKMASPEKWAGFELNEGESLWLLMISANTVDVAHASAARQALTSCQEIFDRKRHPAEWSDAQYVLSYLDYMQYQNAISLKDDKQALVAAQATTEGFRQAFTAMSKQSKPQYWGTGHANMGDAILFLAVARGDIKLANEAVAALEEAERTFNDLKPIFRASAIDLAKVDGQLKKTQTRLESAKAAVRQLQAGSTDQSVQATAGRSTSVERARLAAAQAMLVAEPRGQMPILAQKSYADYRQSLIARGATAD